MNEELKYITFKQFIYTVNIRYFFNEKQDSRSIRIYTDLIEGKENWFDFAWYDFFNKDATWELLETILSPQILESVIDNIWLDDNIDSICIYLVHQPKEDLTIMKN